MMRWGSEWAVNNTFVLGREHGQLGPQVGGDELDEGRLGGPALDAADRDAVRLGRGTSPVEVLPDRERRVVRRQHQSDEVTETLGGQLIDRRLDLRFGVLQAERNVKTARCGSVERGLERGVLGLGAGRQRAGATQRLIAGREVGQLLGVGARPRRMSV